MSFNYFLLLAILVTALHCALIKCTEDQSPMTIEVLEDESDTVSLLWGKWFPPAKDAFCKHDSFDGFYSTGVEYKAVLREDKTSMFGESISRTRSFVFKHSPYSGFFFKHRVLLEGYANARYDHFVAFTGVDIDIYNSPTRMFIEMYRMVNSDQRTNESDKRIYPFNQVAYSAWVWSASKLVELTTNYADPNYWNMCYYSVFDSEDWCIKRNGGDSKPIPNLLFPQLLVNDSKSAPNFVLLFIKSRNTLVLIKNNFDSGSIVYHYVTISNSHDDYREQWEKSKDVYVDFKVIGAFEHYKQYYLVTMNKNESEKGLQLRKILSCTSFPLKLSSENDYDFKEFFGCNSNFADHYMTLVWTIVVSFISLFCYTCQCVAQRRRRCKPMGNDQVDSHMRKVIGSEIEHIPSQYLQRTEANNLYVDEDRMQRENRRVCKSILEMAKFMLKANTTDELREKITRKKRQKWNILTAAK